MGTYPPAIGREQAGGSLAWRQLQTRSLAGSLVESLFLDIVENKGESFSLFTVVLNSDRGGSLDFSWLTVLVVLAVSEPGTNVVSVLNLDEWNVAALCEGLQESVRRDGRM